MSLQEPTNIRFYHLLRSSKKRIFRLRHFYNRAGEKLLPAISLRWLALLTAQNFQSFCCSTFLFSYFTPDSGFLCELWGMDKSLSHLQFSGNDDDFPVWQERFEGFYFTKRAKLLNGLTGGEAGTRGNEEKYELWGYLVQCLDRRSVLMLTNDCKWDGQKAWEVLRNHFNSTETPRLMNMLKKFTTLRLEPSEGMVDYLTRAEYVSKQLELARKKVSESMLSTYFLFLGLLRGADIIRSRPLFLVQISLKL